jgi:hypothetical protein
LSGFNWVFLAAARRQGAPPVMLHCKVALQVGLSGHVPTRPVEKNLIQNPCDVTLVTLMFDT